ncbi:MAG: zinc carboxypeptidase [Saprospiraceae bacterium]|nr:zinc carboxypeptidase [Saprospiraceae bacterium]
MRIQFLIIFLIASHLGAGQNYFYKQYAPFSEKVPAPSKFLGYEIGEFHTRHDQIISYFKSLDEASENAMYIEYGKTYEGRPLSMLVISSAENLKNLENIRKQHLASIDKYDETTSKNLPLVINMGYSVHGNEPSTSEAALLTAYTLLASNQKSVMDYLKHAVIFIDPAINPDGRERHTQWANMYRAEHLVSDNADVEHNENWPRGRVNHYWFDLNRDWLLAIHPESRSKLEWYHQWYPNVIGDFHEMGTNSSFFFEPMKTNGSKNPIMPKENYVDLNNIFGDYYVKAMDSIGSLYFTKEVFDGTYPGYGSSYGDLQGGLALLFEQASSRGHVQQTPYGDMTFSFTIRNQYVAGMSTIQAAIDNKGKLRKYQTDFFKSALTNAETDKIKSYSFGKGSDPNLMKAFIDKLLIHKVKVYYNKEKSGYIVPTKQAQYRMVQTFFETYQVYHDSVFYDASAWSVANFYNIKYQGDKVLPIFGDEIKSNSELVKSPTVSRSDYGYMIDWNDSNAAGALHYLQNKGLVLATSFRPYSVKTSGGKTFNANYGTLMLPVAKQKMTADEIFSHMQEVQNKFQIPIYDLPTGYSVQGVDVGSRHVQALEKPSVVMLIGEGTSAYEAGEVWHHFDQRLKMPVTKVMLHRFKSLDLSKYNSLVLVSGNYSGLDSVDIKKIGSWVSQGNTLIASGTAVSWAIKNKLVKEKLVEGPKKDKSMLARLPFDQADEIMGKESLGGVILKSVIDITHPIGFGYTTKDIPVYKNNTVWLSPSESEYSTISKYTSAPHVDGYISNNIMNDYLKHAASCVVSQIGQGRAILFADNPLFRGSWYSTDRMFTNAIFFGKLIRVPSRIMYEEDENR